MEAAKKLNPSESSDSIRLQKVAQTKSLGPAKRKPGNKTPSHDEGEGEDFVVL